jgi:hypothetical protein
MASQVPVFRQFGAERNDPVFGTSMLSHLDRAAAYAAVAKFRPRRLLEIGSGDSTRFLAKAKGDAEMLCIDPAPRCSISELPVKLVQRVLRHSDIELCAALEPNDILFIDSSHIMLPGTDVDMEFNRIFPRLKPGVIVHVHDIFLPFDYPKGWKKRNWNEQSALVGWLFGAFEIIYPAHYVTRRHPELIDAVLGDLRMPKNAGSFWIRKLWRCDR